MNVWSFNNDESHFAGNDTKVTKKNAGKGASSDGFGKQAEMMRTWRGAAGRSRCGQCDRKSSVADSRQPCTADRQWCGQHRSYIGGFWSRDPRGLEEFIGQIRRYRSVDASIILYVKTVWDGSSLVESRGKAPLVVWGQSPPEAE